MRAAIYTRISKNNPNVPKVEDQEAMCQKLAKAHGYEVVEVYTDDGISASKFLNRPGWNDMLRDVSGGKIDVLVLQSDDRFTRQMLEKETLALACASAGVTWHTVNEGTIDPSTAEGGLRSGLNTLLASYETKRKSERQRQANDAVRDKGLPLAGGDRPFGYEDDKVTLRPAEADLVVQAYRDLTSGKRTLSGIRTQWNRDNVLTTRGKPWDIAKVEKMLRRPRNVQHVQHRGVILEGVIGKWERLIDDETYAAALVLLNDPKRRLTKVHEQKWLLTGLASCGPCGEVLKATTRNNEKVYRCAVHDHQGVDRGGVRHVSVRTHVLDAVVRDAVLSALLMSPVEGLGDPDTSALNRLHVRLGALREERARLVQSVRKGLLEDDDVAADMNGMRTEVAKIEQDMADITRRNAKAALMSEARRELWSGQTADIADAARIKGEIGRRFDALDLPSRRALVKTLVTVTVHGGRTSDRFEVKHVVSVGLNELGSDGVEDESAA
jgi:site-specific DNA recombinase